MEVDSPTSTPPTGPVADTGVPMNVWCFLGKDGAKRFKGHLDLPDPTLKSLKDFVCKVISTQGGGELGANDFDVLYNGGVLQNDASVKSSVWKPMNVITVVQRQPKVDNPPPTEMGPAQITQVTLALRTAFLEPKFITMIMKLGQSEMLENIMAIAPGLQTDPIGVAMIQDPTMIFHLSDRESLKKLAATRPWVVEAFNFLAASIHQDKGQSSQRGARGPSLLQMMMDEDEDEEMEEDEGGAAGSNRPGAASDASRITITREQLSAALNSLSALGRAPQQQQPFGSSSSVLDFFSRVPQSTQQNPTAVPPRPLAAATASSSSVQQGAQATTPITLTPDMVARAMNTALSTLPPEVRETRFSELREQIARIQGQNQPSAATASAVPEPASQQNVQYTSQLSQMREMGIQDERLSVLALRVSDGDVQTAMDLILSGWTGEGADVDMPDEE